MFCVTGLNLSNGEHPLMLRIIKDRKIRYQSLGVSIKAEHRDFDKNKPKHSCPNKDLILKIILFTTQIYLDSFENSQIDKALENLL